jgi:hypothetical protein
VAHLKNRFQGGIIGFNILWNCNLDVDEERCIPRYSFKRLDNEQDIVAAGWNFRRVFPAVCYGTFLVRQIANKRNVTT